MALTRIKAIVNMVNGPFVLINRELSGSPECVAEAFTVAPCDWHVPWCTSSGEFPGHHMDIRIPGFSYSIWQENKFEPREGVDVDRVRFSASGQYEGGAGALGRDSTGAPNIVFADSDYVLVADPRPGWILIYRIGL
jgi:hypothetical protein